METESRKADKILTHAALYIRSNYSVFFWRTSTYRWNSPAAEAAHKLLLDSIGDWRFHRKHESGYCKHCRAIHEDATVTFPENIR